MADDKFCGGRESHVAKTRRKNHESVYTVRGKILDIVKGIFRLLWTF